MFHGLNQFQLHVNLYSTGQFFISFMFLWMLEIYFIDQIALREAPFQSAHAIV